MGTGGFRLGRVDLTIAREPATRLPKIPGTSLHGAVRSYAAYRYGKRNCAGVGLTGAKHCADPKCPICYTFGHIKGTEGGNSGTVSIGDARILLFPVYSLAGTVWATSPEALADFGVQVALHDQKRAGLGGALKDRSHLNLGWLMLERDQDVSSVALPPHIPLMVRERIVVVSEGLFSRVVNSNLEVRTSVGINPDTGAADDKALFTYEAIPRATFLWMEVVEDDYRTERFTATNGWKRPLDVVGAGLEWVQYLGVGGMGTRGFGRLRAWTL
jgi:CRISPR-associated protein Cmr4